MQAMAVALPPRDAMPGPVTRPQHPYKPSRWARDPPLCRGQRPEGDGLAELGDTGSG